MSIIELTTIVAVIISASSSALALLAVRNSQWAAMNDARIRLLEERMKVFHAFRKLLNEFSQKSKVDGTAISDAHSAFETAHFIFSGPEIPTYLDNIIRNIIKHASLEHLSERTPESTDEQMTIQIWLIEQNRDGLKLFQKHMSLLSTYSRKAQP